MKSWVNFHRDRTSVSKTTFGQSQICNAMMDDSKKNMKEIVENAFTEGKEGL